MNETIAGRGKRFIFGLIFLFLMLPGYCFAAGDFEVTLNTSRTQGVAPLSVFFDGTRTPDLAGGSYVDATFAWDFDADNADPDANHRRAAGFVAAHVFEKPGVYRVRVDVYDLLGRHAWEDVTITVTAFAGTTYYVAEDGADTNDGLSMAAPVQTVQHALTDLARPNTRILFKKGDTFYTRYVSASEHPGPVIVASYEDPADPSDQAPIIYNTAVDSDWGTLDIGNDWRIMDLRVRSGGSSAGEEGPRYPGGVGFGNSTNGLIYRLEQDHLASGWMAPYGQYNTVAECNIHDVSGTGYCSDGDGGAIIGNWVHDKGPEDPEHIFRLQGGTRYFIAFNNFEANVVNYDSLTIRGNTSKVVIYKNTLDRVTGIWPQVRNHYEEYQHHCLIDSNLFVGRNNPPGYITTTPIRQLAIGLHAKDIVIRNNIIHNYEMGINIGDDTVVGPSQRIKIYNNTFINMTAGSNFYVVNIDPACSGIEIYNNAILDQAGSNVPQTFLIHDSSETNTFNGASNYQVFYGSSWSPDMRLFNSYDLSDWQAQTGNDANSSMLDPRFAGLDYESANFALPLAGSPLIDKGRFTGAVYDYYGNKRDLATDIGAVEYISGAVDTQSPSVPQGVTALSVSSSRIDLSWDAASDNIAVAGYRIYSGGVRIGVTSDTTFSHTTCAAATQYTYTIRAYDAAGNTSNPSEGVSATTQPSQVPDSGGGSGGGGGCFISVVFEQGT